MLSVKVKKVKKLNIFIKKMGSCELCLSDLVTIFLDYNLHVSDELEIICILNNTFMDVSKH